MQQLEVFDCMALVVENRAFGDLERDPLCLAIVLLEHRREADGQFRIHQIARRDVHRHVHRHALSSPRRALLDGMRDNPMRDLADRARLFRKRNEFHRRHHSATGMLPADERFNVKLAVAAERHLRLIHQQQLVVVDRAAQIADQRQAFVAVLLVAFVPDQ